MFGLPENIKKSYIPMSETALLMLMCLTSPCHGYKIMQDVQRITDGRVVLGVSTVYTILYKMENDGLISVCAEEDRRKIYKITSYGKLLLLEERKRIESVLKSLNAAIEMKSIENEEVHI